MKLNKILMPALTIASVGAIVTPIVTSCNKTVGVKVHSIKQYTSDNSWISDEFKFKGGQTVSFTGEDFVMVTGMTKLYIGTFNSTGDLWEIKTISVNGKQKEVKTTGEEGVYYCELDATETPVGRPLIVDITHTAGGSGCYTALNLDNN